MSFPILTAIIVTPIIGAVLVLCTPANRPELARAVGYLATAATLGFALYLLWHFKSIGTFQFVEENRWFDSLGVGYIVGVDGFSIFMVVVTALLMPIGLLASAQLDHRVKAYTFWFLLLEGAIMGIFLALDLIAFFVFWEAMLVPMYFLIAGWGSKNRAYAATKFFIYTAFGSAFLLASILVLAFLYHSQTGHPLTFDYRILRDWNGLATSTETWLFFGFMAAFAIKAPLFPFHTWLPDVHTEAPTAGSVVLAGVILKMGAYGFLRFSFELFPHASVRWAPLIITLAVIGIIYGSIVAAMQKDAKRIIAFSSVAHMGFILLGIFSITVFGLDGASFNMVSHPLTTGSLFLVIGFLYERRHTREISEFGGIWKSAPILTAFFLIAMFAGIGLPGFSGFIGEFLALVGAFLVHRWWAIVATVGVILAAVYMLWMFQRVFTGVPNEANKLLKDVSLREIAVVAPLLALSLFIGLYPKPVLSRVEPTVQRVVKNFDNKVKDYHQPDADKGRNGQKEASR
jgi:NADH-quinone oxidoreductase subunit M